MIYCIHTTGIANNAISFIVWKGVIKMGKYNITSFRHLGDTLVEVERWVRWKYYDYDAYIGSIIFGDTIKEIING
jgi:hypothetical protein